MWIRSSKRGKGRGGLDESRPHVRRRVLAGSAALALGTALWLALPVPKEISSPDAQGVTIVDRHGQPLRTTRATDGTNATWIPYDRIDPDVINAFVAVEDRRFWTHHGVDPRAVARAVRQDLRARAVVSGASTLTMQLARLLHPHDRTIFGKLGEAAWAMRLELHLTKQEILEQYLNRVQLGQGTVGIGAATGVYFGASPSEMSVGQAAMLAGLAHAPSRDNPIASASRARVARAAALRRMRSARAIDDADVARAMVEPVRGTTSVAPFRAPHFTTRVLAWTANDRRAGTSTITTSIDLALQDALESEVRHTVDMLQDRGVADAAVVVLDNTTGEVLAWVGSPDFWGAKDGQTDMVVSPRQPGSALKPFLYALAFDRGFTAASVLPDVPRSYATATGPYAPRNYDRRFHGPTRAREALASSYNIPAVELASRVGAGSLLQTLRLAGFESLSRDAEHYGLGLSLGNGDVTLVELANAYRALANGGAWRPWTWQRVAPGVAPADGRRVVSPEASALVLDVLRDPVARIPGFGLLTPFDFPFPVAVKTGTSRHFTDNWAVGTTRGFTVAVWAGNFDGRPMDGVSGVTGAGPLLHRAVMAVSRVVPPGAFATPAELGATTVAVCRLSGLRATDGCAAMDEWFYAGTAPTRDDDWERDGRITLPDEYADWAARDARVTFAASRPVSVPLGDAEPAPISTLATRFHIVSPLDGDRYGIPTGIDAKYATIALRAGGPGADRVTWTVDGARFDAERWTLVPGLHEIEATSAKGDRVQVKIVVDR